MQQKRVTASEIPTEHRTGPQKRGIQYLLVLLCLSLLLFYPRLSHAQLIEPNSPAVETSGDIILLSLPAVALGSTLVLKDYDGTWEFTKGFLLNQAVTLGLKYAINKDRPFKSGHYAFPSGHTSITTQAASFIFLRYGWEYGVPALALAGWTGYSRINATRHDGWDVLAGTVVGIGSSLLFTTPYKERDIQLTFHSDDEQWLVGLRYTF